MKKIMYRIFLVIIAVIYFPFTILLFIDYKNESKNAKDVVIELKKLWNIK